MYARIHWFNLYYIGTPIAYNNKKSSQIFSTQWSLVENPTRSIKKINGELTYYILNNIYTIRNRV